MKLDLVEIRELSPPDLWDLGVLSELISCLQCMIAARIGRGWPVLLYARIVAQYSNELREKTRENLNLRIKAWVMQCPERIIRVRTIIGEAAIRRWRKNRLADYALTKYFGDWRRKFPDGFEDQRQKRPKQNSRHLNHRPYMWKLFSLTKIINVEGFLYKQSTHSSEMTELQAAYYKLWGTSILDGIKRSQPRAKRNFKPVEFTPYELMPEMATGSPKDKEDGAVISISRKPKKPPKPLHISAQPTPKHPVPKTSREPPTQTHDQISSCCSFYHSA